MPQSKPVHDTSFRCYWVFSEAVWRWTVWKESRRSCVLQQPWMAWSLLPCEWWMSFGTVSKTLMNLFLIFYLLILYFILHGFVWTEFQFSQFKELQLPNNMLRFWLWLVYWLSGYMLTFRLPAFSPQVLCKFSVSNQTVLVAVPINQSILRQQKV